MTSREESRAPRRVGIRDVAARAEVGIATVSRVLSGSADVREDLRDRVLVAAAELGYQPDILAQSLRRGATRSVGFISDDLTDRLFADIATGAEAVLRAHGYSLLVMNSELDPDLDPVHVGVLRARRVDALMMCPVEEDHPATAAALATLDVPLCVIEGDQPPAVRASYVHSDHRAGVVMALEHLRSLGHERIVLLTGPDRYRSARQRALGLADVAATARPGEHLVRVATELQDADAQAAMARAIEVVGPTAVVVGGARLLLGVLRAIEEAGMELARDLALVTSDAPVIATMFRPPLASISRDGDRLGRTAAELLLARIADRALAPETVVLPVVYEPRGSVAPPRTAVVAT
jgi:LacI family transcriptional regulator